MKLNEKREIKYIDKAFCFACGDSGGGVYEQRKF